MASASISELEEEVPLVAEITEEQMAVEFPPDSGMAGTSKIVNRLHWADFRGAMSGRGDKGLVITTGTFTPAAKAEATRDGAPPVDLIGGDELCDLLKEYRLGVDVDVCRMR